ncbi:MAG TPA: ParB/RepB/Spo0J family partition protein [Geminicoccaceae bacterium]|nr:ParB/RepB/Spo0J family partition protein [Geminicoccus sp.]HMU51889.1 ParB/RepB/Spo0J family partition protein [Geminicoccaceae bacterium]
MTVAGGRKRGLGMGLSALLGHPGDLGGGEAPVAQRLPIDLLVPSPFQPRRDFPEEQLETLAQSIRERGVLQPLLVRPATGDRQGSGYEIVAGERRWRAAQRAGLHEVPAVVREMGDATALELALIENLQRQDLSAMDEAEACQRLIREFGHTQEDVARALGRSRSHVANTLRLLGLPEAVRNMVRDGSLSAGHARAILGAAEPERLALQIVVKQLSVRQAEALARQAAGSRTRLPADPDLAMVERDLSTRLGLRVAIRPSGRGGTLTLRYTRPDQLEELLRKLGRSSRDR